MIQKSPVKGKMWIQKSARKSPQVRLPKMGSSANSSIKEPATRKMNVSSFTKKRFVRRYASFSKMESSIKKKSAVLTIPNCAENLSNLVKRTAMRKDVMNNVISFILMPVEAL